MVEEEQELAWYLQPSVAEARRKAVAEGAGEEDLTRPSRENEFRNYMNSESAISVNGSKSMYNSFPVFARWALHKKTAAEQPPQMDTMESKEAPVKAEENNDQSEKEEEHHACIRGR